MAAQLSKTLQRYENKSKSQQPLTSIIQGGKLSKTLQRYENKSKSQLYTWITSYCWRCLRHCKDTKIKANHNIDDEVCCAGFVV